MDPILVEKLIKLGMAVLIGGIVGVEREFQDKAAGFRTIILITHEPDVAAAAKRVIVLRDGRVLEDNRIAAVGARPSVLVDADPPKQTVSA